VTGKVAVLGDSDFVMPFSALGLDTFEAGKDASETAKIAGEIAEADYALVIIAENVAPAAQDAFASVQNKARPCVIVVPFTTESTGFATQALGEALRIATGVNILKNN
jgi:vacuolar-type H+-ATPase subunit F/Vma7